MAEGKKKKQGETVKPDTDKSRLSVDRDRLDEDWEKQADFSWEFGEQLANAKLELDTLKGELEVIKAELDLKIRRDPERYLQTEKITESAVKAYVTLSKKVQRKETEIIEKKHEIDILTSYLKSIDDKKRALEKLVDLHGQNYFAKPRAPEHSREAMESIERRNVRRGVKKKKSKKGAK